MLPSKADQSRKVSANEDVSGYICMVAQGGTITAANVKMYLEEVGVTAL